MGSFLRLLADGVETSNPDSPLGFAKAAVLRGTCDFAQISAGFLEGARAVPLCEESQKLLQNTDNEEHAKGKRAALPVGVCVAHVESVARCQLLGNSGVIWLVVRRKGRFQQRCFETK
jgi:hypothetical protein